MALSDQKKLGAAAAREWIATAKSAEIVKVAGMVFDYGENLDDVKSDGFEVPASSDKDFSWGFYKQVKSHVTHRVNSAHRRRVDSQQHNSG